MRVALVHDWLTGRRGGEKCLEALCRLYPGADLYTLLYRPGSTGPLIENRRIRTSFLQHVPGILQWYRFSLPAMPLAVSRLRIRGRYDLIVSLSHAVAKSIVPPPGVPHVCYCFTPMRYAWHLYGDYFEGREGPRKTHSLIRSLAHWLFLRHGLFAGLRAWDRRTAGRVDLFVAISRTVQRRIRDAYGRTSDVIYPPVDTVYYCPGPDRREDYYFCVSALAPYKRVDLAIRACQQAGRKLVVVGKGAEAGRLRRLAGPKVRLLGWQPDDVVRDHLRRCRALLFPGREDFGIVPLEAQACGTPVIAFAEGGACESVLPATENRTGTGVFFNRQEPAAIVAAIEWLESHPRRMSAQLARRQAEAFSTERFEREIGAYFEAVANGRPPAESPARGTGRRIEVHQPHAPALPGVHPPRSLAREDGALVTIESRGARRAPCIGFTNNPSQPTE